MKKFWKTKSKPRSWEEISTPKKKEELGEMDDVDTDENKADFDSVSDTDNDKNDKEIHTENAKKLRKNGTQKIDKIINSLDFDPTVYYGWGDGKVDTWMQKLTKIWNVAASVVWFIFGSITFAPILFTANKIDKFFNDKKKSFFIATALYLFAIVILAIIIVF